MVAGASTTRATPTFAELFTPKLVTILREGYGWPTCAPMRWPASPSLSSPCPCRWPSPSDPACRRTRASTPPSSAAFSISALGGSRFQIGGPAGAFIVLIASIVERHGYDGLVLATLMAGLMMIGIGLMRLGTYIKYIPFPVTVGFTAGIAVIIFASQLRELLGLDMAKEPAALLPKLAAIGTSLHTIKPQTVLLALLAIAHHRGPSPRAAEVARPSHCRDRDSFPDVACSASTSRPSAHASEACRTRRRHRPCPPSISQRSRPCFPMPSPSRFSAQSNLCSRRSWPTA